VVFYFGIQDARSRRSAAAESLHRSPRQPIQTQSRAPQSACTGGDACTAPIKYLAGLEEPLVATGPVTEEEGRDLDIALASFHNAPLQATPGSDYSDYAKPCLLSSRCIRTQTGTPPSTQTSDSAITTRLLQPHIRRVEKAWQLGRDATTPQARLMVDAPWVNWRRCMRGWATGRSWKHYSRYRQTAIGGLRPRRYRARMRACGASRSIPANPICADPGRLRTSHHAQGQPEANPDRR